jgi:hypothetical protein
MRFSRTGSGLRLAKVSKVSQVHRPKQGQQRSRLIKLFGELAIARAAGVQAAPRVLLHYLRRGKLILILE